MTRYPIGTRCVIVDAVHKPHFIGMECTIERDFDPAEFDFGKTLDRYDYAIRIDDMTSLESHGLFGAKHSQLRPIDGRPANTVISWESCPFQPEREVAA